MWKHPIVDIYCYRDKSFSMVQVYICIVTTTAMVGEMLDQVGPGWILTGYSGILLQT